MTTTTPTDRSHTIPTSGAPAPTVNITGLVCRECGQTEALGASHVCGFCFGPLAVQYDAATTARVTRARIEAGPSSVWRYQDLLPVLSDDPALRVDLGTGFSPLRRAPRLAERLGIRELWLKDDTRNPTGSFKDRVVTMALSAGRALGIDTFACASTGNLANSVAGHAAAIGAEAYVFIPHDLEQGKVVNSAIYGPNLIAVEGNYDDVNRLCAEVADEKGWGFVNVNLRAFYAEGSKTLGFEIAEQLGWRFPDHVVGPVASGSMFTKIHTAFEQFRDLGLVDGELPRMSGAQATGCSPVAEAFARGSRDVRPQRPDTIAKSLAIGNPADGTYAVGVAQDTDGTIGHVSDQEVVDGIRLLAETEGIFGETACGVTIANLKRFAESGHVRPDEEVVAVLSGHGLKTLEAVAPAVGPTFTTSPALDDFNARLGADADQA